MGLFFQNEFITRDFVVIFLLQLVTMADIPFLSMPVFDQETAKKRKLSEISAYASEVKRRRGLCLSIWTLLTL